MSKETFSLLLIQIHSKNGIIIVICIHYSKCVFSRKKTQYFQNKVPKRTHKLFCSIKCMFFSFLLHYSLQMLYLFFIYFLSNFEKQECWCSSSKVSIHIGKLVWIFQDVPHISPSLQRMDMSEWMYHAHISPGYDIVNSVYAMSKPQWATSDSTHLPLRALGLSDYLYLLLHLLLTLFPSALVPSWPPHAHPFPSILVCLHISRSRLSPLSQ